MSSFLSSAFSTSALSTLAFDFDTTVVADPDYLGGGASLPHHHHKRRDYAAEVFKEIQDKQDALDKAEKALADKRAFDLEKNLTVRQAKRLDKELLTLRAETLRLQLELQNLVAMKERMDMDNEDLLILSMCMPFNQLKL